MTSGRERGVTLFLCGDVMTGRGIDQVLPNSCPPHLFEPFARSALDYVDLAEREHGPIPRPVDFAYVWGEALPMLAQRRPDARIINLETSITTSERAADKGINYRMHPGNVAVLNAAAIDCCVVANNHVLDWGEAGLLETLDTLTRAGIRTAGAGRERRSAEAPARIELADGGRILVFGFAVDDSGVPSSWAAERARPGVNRLPALDAATVDHVAATVHAAKRPNDLVLASIHWGSNWGYEIPIEHRRFAHALVDEAGVDLVHGHSSHHAKAIEVYRERLILHGCGDFLNDYEGIRGYERFRSEITSMYFPTLAPDDGRLIRLELTPLVIRNFRLNRPSAEELAWIRATLDRECRRFDRRIVAREDSLLLE